MTTKRCLHGGYRADVAGVILFQSTGGFDHGQRIKPYTHVNRQTRPVAAGARGGGGGFCDFLRHKDQDSRLTQAATQTAEPSFKKVWDNPDDAVYDAL